MRHTVPGERLRAAANFVRQGACFADIGTDHALLPLYLLQTRKITRAFASDTAEGPLCRARENIEAAGFAGAVTLLRADGLIGLEALGLTDIAICGMGGELIASILAAAPFVKNPDIRLILQPMSRPASLRRYLAAQGFAVREERVGLSAGRVYSCLLAVYTGQPYSLSLLQTEVGNPTPADRAAREAYLQLLTLKENTVRERLAGRQRGARQTGEDEELLAALRAEKERVCHDSPKVL